MKIELTEADIKRLQPEPLADVLAALTQADLYEAIHWGDVFDEKARAFSIVLNNIAVDELTRRDDERDSHPVPLPFHLWSGHELGQALACCDALANGVEGYGLGQLVDRLKVSLNGVVMMRLRQMDNIIKPITTEPEAKNDNN